MAGKGRPDIIRRQQEKILILDGAMGTAIMAAALNPDDYQGHDGCHDYLTLSRPEVISAIHSSYLAAGCDIIETNTFGAQAGELAKYGLQERTYELNRKAAELAAAAASAHSTPGQPRYAAGSMGPGSRLPSLQQTDFASLEDSYYAQGLGLLDGGVDLFQVETCQDMLQAKAALRALSRVFRERQQRRPVSLLVTLEKDRMLLGTDIATALATFIPYPLFAFGINCGTGPADMQDAVRNLAEASPFPLAVMPNAGLPKFSDGKYVYDLEPALFARQMGAFVSAAGAALVGGCCGTTPRHIRALARQAGGLAPALRKKIPRRGQATSLFATQEFRVRPAPLIIGEQTNASGSRKFKAALLADDLDAMLAVAQEQAREGAHLLDLNVGFAGRSEARDMERIAARLNGQNRLPLMLDSTSLEALEAGLKQCAGRAVINSINLEDGGARAEAILALAADFGAAVVCLAIDEKGMARDRERKVAVLQRLYDLALARGIDASGLFLDPLTFTLASGDPGLADAGKETLAALPILKKRMPAAQTMLGVSNISYGLQPAARKIVNAVFLYHAVQQGLDAAIFHAARILPLNRIAAEEIRLAEDLIFNRRGQGQDRDPLRVLCNHFQERGKGEVAHETVVSSPEEHLRAAILDGNAAGIGKDIEALAEKMPALDIVNDHLLKGMAEVGELFEKGIMQLPFVLQAAEVIKAAMDLLEPRLAKSPSRQRGCMLLATVKGDVHDIGKNLVDIILRSNGYRVVNLGTNRGGADIAAAVDAHAPDHVGLSALLVKSTLEMTEILRYLEEKKIRIPVICGGAALTPDFVDGALRPLYRGKVFYAADAFAALKIMNGSAAAAANPVSRKIKPAAAVRVRSLPTPWRAPFSGTRVVHWTLDDVLTGLDKKTLIKSRWRMKEGPEAEQFYDESLSLLRKKRITRFSGVYGYFDCRRSGKNSLLIRYGGKDYALTFPRRQRISLADYFSEKEDLAPIFVVSCGGAISRLEKELFDSDQYSRYLIVHGFGTQLAESLAAKMHQHIRQELGLAGKRGKRFSPGFPAWPELSDQKTLAGLLHAQRIGVSVSESCQLLPELSVSALVVCHPQAKYF
jgi:5-methyltetrahydrofolate--homocysteine methyltransferase